MGNPEQIQNSELNESSIAPQIEQVESVPWVDALVPVRTANERAEHMKHVAKFMTRYAVMH